MSDFLHKLGRTSRDILGRLGMGVQRVNNVEKPIVAESSMSLEALRQNNFRGYIYFPQLDVKKHITRHSRHEIQRRSQWLYDNVGLIKYFVEETALLEAGTGSWPKPRTSNPQWNRKVSDRFHETWGDPMGFDVEGKESFYSVQVQIRRHIKRGNDHFGVLVRSEGGMAQMKFYPGYMIDNPAGAATAEKAEELWADGVRLSKLGRPLAYRFLGSQPDSYSDIDAAYVQHYHDPLWSGQRRGMGMLHHAVAKMLTIDDISYYEQKGIKLGSQVGYVMYVPEGGGGPSLPNLPGSEGSEVVENSDGSKLTIQKIFTDGSVIPALEPGYKIETLKQDRPGGNVVTFLDWLIKDVSAGCLYSPEFLWFLKDVGSAVARLMNDRTRLRIESTRQNLEMQFCRPAYKYWLWHEIARGEFEYPGDDWYKHDFLTPRDVTMDHGREGKLNDDRFATGKIGPRQYYGPMGLDEEEVEDDIIASAARRKRKVALAAEAEGIELTMEECFPRPAGSAPAQTGEPAYPDEDDEGKLKKKE